MADPSPQRHVVVFDCNVFLDIGSLLGGFSWEDFSAHAARNRTEALPATDARVDSLRAAAVTTSGRFAGAEPLEVWTSDHVERMVRSKAVQPIDGPEDRKGLGLTAPDAGRLVDDLVGGLVDKSGGDSVGTVYPEGDPPLDHEDGLVFGACRWLASEDPLSVVYCVTRDQGFLKAYERGELGTAVRVLSPATFLRLVRAARAMVGAAQIRPRPA